ncbi:MAG: hypothetical protein HKN26_05330 [Acidimicrobiales bacterium]|nr:hypothetical protein [Acidimicrobiales bacterium]
MTPVAELLASRIAAHGPLPFSEVMEAALYHPKHGFYSGRGQAGRRGDFITSPEVGPLFGAVVAQALDSWWRGYGCPESFVMIDAGAGPGTLARSIRAAAPDCLPAVRYLAVERSSAQHDSHPDGVESRVDLPPVDPTAIGVVIANELLDNLPFDLLQYDRDVGWSEVLVDVADDGLVETAVPVENPAPWIDLAGAPPQFRMPLFTEAQSWLRRALGLFGAGRVVVFDYAEQYPTDRTDWLRTYRSHEVAADPLAELGHHDITANVDVGALERVRPTDVLMTQADWLARHGIDDLVAEGKRVWSERAHLGDLAAVRARSRVAEAEALLDPEGLGRFLVLEWYM